MSLPLPPHRNAAKAPADAAYAAAAGPVIRNAIKYLLITVASETTVTRDGLPNFDSLDDSARDLVRHLIAIIRHAEDQFGVQANDDNGEPWPDWLDRLIDRGLPDPTEANTEPETPATFDANQLAAEALGVARAAVLALCYRISSECLPDGTPRVDHAPRSYAKGIEEFLGRTASIAAKLEAQSPGWVLPAHPSIRRLEATLAELGTLKNLGREDDA